MPRGRKPGSTNKTTSTPKTTPKTTPKVETSNEIEELKKQNQLLQQQMQEMLRAMKNPTVSASTDVDKFNGKKIKVISLLDNPIKIGQGTYAVKFNRYGEERRIKFDVLEHMVAGAKERADRVRKAESFFERGCIYIADAEAVEELGLTSYYETILNKETIDKIVALTDETCINLFMGASIDIKETILSMIAKNIKDGQSYDLNLVNKINDISNKDVVQMSKDLL